MTCLIPKNLVKCVMLVVLAGTTLILPAQDESKRSKQEKNYIRGKNLFFEAHQERLRDNLDESLKLFQESLKFIEDNDAAYFEIARIQDAMGKPREALESAARAQKLRPENFHYQTYLAQLYLKAGEPKEAIGIYEDLIRKNPNHIPLYLMLAGLYERQGDIKKAEECYIEAEKRAGFSFEISSQRISNYLKAGQFEKALRETQRLIDLYPEQLEFREMLVDIHLFAGDLKKAREAAESMLEIDDMNGRALIKMANISLQERNIRESIRYCEKAFALPEVEIDEKMGLMLVFFDITGISKDYLDDIYGLLELMIQAHPEDPKPYSMYGDFLKRDQNLEMAVEQFKQAVSLAPDKHLIWEEILIIQNQLGWPDSVLATAQQAVSYFPNRPGFYFFQGVAHIQLGKPEAAKAVLETGEMLILDNPGLQQQFYSALGDACHGMGEHKKSDNYYEKALELNPRDAYVLNNYSYYLSLRRKDLDKALEMSKRAVAIDPENASFLDTHGWVLFQLERYQDALKYIEESIRMSDGGNAEVLEHLGDVLYKLQRTNEAREAWKKALKAGANPDIVQPKIQEGL